MTTNWQDGSYCHPLDEEMSYDYENSSDGSVESVNIVGMSSINSNCIVPLSLNDHEWADSNLHYIITNGLPKPLEESNCVRRNSFSSLLEHRKEQMRNFHLDASHNWGMTYTFLRPWDEFACYPFVGERSLMGWMVAQNRIDLNLLLAFTEGADPLAANLDGDGTVVDSMEGVEVSNLSTKRRNTSDSRKRKRKLARLDEGGITQDQMEIVDASLVSMEDTFKMEKESDSDMDIDLED